MTSLGVMPDRNVGGLACRAGSTNGSPSSRPLTKRTAWSGAPSTVQARTLPRSTAVHATWGSTVYTSPIGVRRASTSR